LYTVGITLFDRFRAIWAILVSAEVVLDYGIKHKIARIYELTEILSKISVALVVGRQITGF
jgi:hypothetical protein